MQTKGQTYTAARQIAFFAPKTGGGKYHAAWLITDTAVCGYTGELEPAQVIHSAEGKVPHSLCCKRCQRSSVVPGVSAVGIKR